MGGIPWSTTHAALHRLLRSRPLLPLHSTVLVAVSGGQDSVCLLRLLVDLRPKWGWQLRAVHCDHRWRADSAANGAFVADLCDRWGVPCSVVVAEGNDRDRHTEAAARQWRYTTFERVATAQGCTRVVTGHTASDRAETLIYNLLRGSGSDGLQALTWQRPIAPGSAIAVVRPLLDLTRPQTLAFCHQFDLPLWEDTTNADLRYARNRIRLELLPYLRQHFNPSVESTLAQTAELLSAEVDLLESLATSLYQQTVVPAQASQIWAVARSPLAAAPLALRRRVLRRLLPQITAAPASFEQVEKLVVLLTAPQGSQSDPLPGGAIARVDGDWLRIGAPTPPADSQPDPPQALE